MKRQKVRLYLLVSERGLFVNVNRILIKHSTTSVANRNYIDLILKALTMWSIITFVCKPVLLYERTIS